MTGAVFQSLAQWERDDLGRKLLGKPALPTVNTALIEAESHVSRLEQRLSDLRKLSGENVEALKAEVEAALKRAQGQLRVEKGETPRPKPRPVTIQPYGPIGPVVNSMNPMDH